MRDLEALKIKIGKTPEEDRLVVVINDYLEQLGDLKKRMSKIRPVDDEATVFPQEVETIVDANGGETVVPYTVSEWILPDTKNNCITIRDLI